jgi:carbonic anhydrase
MVFACSDARVCPSVTLGLQLGEAFTVRNIANMVPAYDKVTSSSPGSSGVTPRQHVFACLHFPAC